uniref:Uncharacterized protein n=1 Tax=Anopheles dirus TaxID=7168 RepID=A0A182NXQ6_9DIPT
MCVEGIEISVRSSQFCFDLSTQNTRTPSCSVQQLLRCTQFSTGRVNVLLLAPRVLFNGFRACRKDLAFLLHLWSLCCCNVWRGMPV